MNRKLFPFVVTIATFALLVTPAFADTAGSPDVPLPFKHVTLYTSGVGYFQRSGQVVGDASDTLYFPLDQVNDVLKSLVLLDEGGGSIQPVTFAAKDPIDRQLQAFGINVSDNPDRATLYNRLRGANVTVAVSPDDSSAAAKSYSGVVVGVETRTITLPATGSATPATTTESTLNLLAADGIHSIPLDRLATLKIDDAQLDSELREALMAVGQARDANKRPVKLNFHGTGNRTVEVGYVAEAPVWQSSYRLVLGGATTKDPSILQGWALVQNTSQDDWNNIALTLVSGRPVSFIQDLYTPLYVRRPVIQSQLAEALSPVSYNSNLYSDRAVEAEQQRTSVSGATTFAMKSDLAAAAPSVFSNLRSGEQNSFNTSRMLAGTVGSVGARLGDSLFTYSIAVPVTIPRQQSAMIPFTSSPVEATRVGIYNSGVNSEHPMTGVRIKNTSNLHLLGGPITVFDEAGDTSYVGDAIMDDTQPDQTRLISFALDVPVDAKVGGNGIIETSLGLKIVKGMLYLQVRQNTGTTYTFKNNGTTDQTIVVEYPDQGEQWKISQPATFAEHTATVYRYDLPVPAGASKALEVDASRVVVNAVGLNDQDLPNILLYMKRGNISDSVKDALKALADKMSAIDAANNKLTEVNRQIVDLNTTQDRIRENMKVLDHTSALYQRYSTELDAQETKLDALGTQRDTLNADIAAQKQALSDYIANLTIGELPSP